MIRTRCTFDRATRGARAFGLGLAIAIAAPYAPAHAEGPSADALKAQGDAAMDARRFLEALAAYDAAYAAQPGPTLLYNRARALQALGRYPEALAAIARFQATAPPDVLVRVPKLEKLVADLRAHVATLVVSCDTAGAQVRVRGEARGSTPIGDPIVLAPGRASVEVEAAGMRPFRQEIDLSEGTTLRMNVALVPAIALGTLAIRASAPGTDIEIDGHAAGVVPLELELAPGTHAIVARREGFETVRTSAVVGAMARAEVDLALTPHPPITSRWWFWTAIGVVAAGATVAIAAGLTERSPSSGNASPGTVRGPLVRF
jgi:hypothetical protein